MSVGGTRGLLLDAYHAALGAVGGRASVRAALEAHAGFRPTHVFAVGKAAAYMMAGAMDARSDSIDCGLVLTKHGHVDGQIQPEWPVECIESSHPVPDRSCLVAGARLREFVASAPADAVFLSLMSGGASSLVEDLPDGFDESDLARITEWMLGAGLPIGSMNRIRKCVSRIKGGRLAQAVAGRPLLNLAISDVPGDDPRVIGSGLVVAHAPDDLDISGIDVPDWLARLASAAPALPPPECFDGIDTRIVARPADARAKAAAACEAVGLPVRIHDDLLEGDALLTGRALGERLASAEPGIDVWGSETTVVLPESPGRGGRCQSLALAAAEMIAGDDRAFLLAAGTDGTDGPGEDAGAVVDGGTVDRGLDAGLDVARALARADAGSFLQASGDLIHTGPTGTNVMDLIIACRRG